MGLESDSARLHQIELVGGFTLLEEISKQTELIPEIVESQKLIIKKLDKAIPNKPHE